MKLRDLRAFLHGLEFYRYGFHRIVTPGYVDLIKNSAKKREV